MNYLIKRAEDAGSHFFSPDTMRFFRSRLLPTLRSGKPSRGKSHIVFITSEQYGNAPRRYTVRVARFGKVASDFEILTIGDYQAFSTSARAHTFAKWLAYGHGY